MENRSLLSGTPLDGIDYGVYTASLMRRAAGAGLLDERALRRCRRGCWGSSVADRVDYARREQLRPRGDRRPADGRYRLLHRRGAQTRSDPAGEPRAAPGTLDGRALPDGDRASGPGGARLRRPALPGARDPHPHRQRGLPDFARRHLPPVPAGLEGPQAPGRLRRAHRVPARAGRSPRAGSSACASGSSRSRWRTASAAGSRRCWTACCAAGRAKTAPPPPRPM